MVQTGPRAVNERAGSPAARMAAPRTLRYAAGGAPGFSVRIGLFGFPKTGKSTLFRLLTGASATSHGPHLQVGVARVPDSRLERLAAVYRPKKVTPATVEVLDSAPVGRGRAGGVFPLDALVTVDALAHVVRAFRDPAVPHVAGNVDPARDVGLMETELLLADHAIAERRIAKLRPLAAKTRREEDVKELALLERCLAAVEREVPLRGLDLGEEDQKRLRGYTFLSLKPLLVALNVDEADAARLGEGPAAFGLGLLEGRPRTAAVVASAKIESEIAALDPAEADSFRRELGIERPALDRLVEAFTRLLDRVCFFTVSEEECRAVAVRRGTRAREAAGAVHSDMERGFIRAEVVAWEDLVAAGSVSACRHAGTLRIEGKDYVVRDGDVLHFRFSA